MKQEMLPPQHTAVECVRISRGLEHTRIVDLVKVLVQKPASQGDEFGEVNK
jgi:hypothetical protein